MYSYSTENVSKQSKRHKVLLHGDFNEFKSSLSILEQRTNL